MSTTSKYKSSPQHQPSHGYSQIDYRHHDKSLGTYSRAPYPDSEPSHSSQKLETFNFPAYNSSELSVEEIRREFSPPGSEPYQTRYQNWYGVHFQPRQAYTMNSSLHEEYTNKKDPQSTSRRLSDHQDQKSVKSFKTSKPESESLSQNEIIIAALGGTALALGGKELWDRRNAKKKPTKSNPLQTAVIGAAGALAGYEGAEIYKNLVKKDRKSDELYSSSQSQVKRESKKKHSKSLDHTRSRQSRSSHRSTRNELLDLNSSERSRYDRRNEKKRYNFDDSSSRGTHSISDSTTRLQQLAKTALLAGATEAFRVRKEPGGWSGDKGKRVLTAAIGASTIDAVAEGTGKRHILEAIIRGLASNRLINSPTKYDDSRSVSSKSQHRSQSRNSKKDHSGSLASLLTAGLGALTGKKMLEKPRSRSRSKISASRRRQRSSSLSSSCSSSSEQRSKSLKHKRNKSVTSHIREGIATLRLGEDNERRRYRKNSLYQRSNQSDSETDYHQKHSTYYYSVDHDGRRHYRPRYVDHRDDRMRLKRREDSRSHKHRSRSKTRNVDERGFHHSDSYCSSILSTDDEKSKIIMRDRS